MHSCRPRTISIPDFLNSTSVPDLLIEVKIRSRVRPQALIVRWSPLVVVVGEWSSWTPWEPCSETCGGGTRSRTRMCYTPTIHLGGADCEGGPSENESCNEGFCPSKCRPREEFQANSRFLNSISVHDL